MSNLQKEMPKNWLKNEKVQILEFGGLFWLSLSQKLTILDIEEISQHTTGISKHNQLKKTSS
jgi:hypothetical protein